MYNHIHSITKDTTCYEMLFAVARLREILQEPTTGLDPISRRGVWAGIAAAKDSGSCLLITTHMPTDFSDRHTKQNEDFNVMS